MKHFFLHSNIIWSNPQKTTKNKSLHCIFKTFFIDIYKSNILHMHPGGINNKMLLATQEKLQNKNNL